MKKKILVGVTAFCLLSLGAVSTVYSASTHVTVNGVSYSVNTLNEDFNRDVLSKSPVFTNDELNKFVTYTYDLSAIKKRGVIDKVKDKFTNADYKVDYTYEVDFDGLESWFDNYNSNATKSRNAKIIKGKKLYKIRSEVEGTQINYEIVKDLLDNKKYNINIEDFYIKPTVYSNELESSVSEANKYIKWSYSYSNGNTIESDIDYVTVSKKGNIKIDDSWLDDAVRSAIGSYNTVGKARKFKTHSGNTITVSGGLWGSEVDTQKEIDKVKTAFNSCKSKKKQKPEYSVYREDIGNTYAEVSISAQHVWIYKNGKCIMDSPCVTGNMGNHDTPRGVYYVMERINGKYLTGPGYKTWVNKWMRLTWTGVGFHDATWRSNFGGSIYTYSGSHGCINLPYSFASRLFETVYVGMPAVIHD